MPGASFSSTSFSRRQEYAAATRAAIVQAGRELFAQQGFIATTVEDIAARARVAPATVYTSVGGKHAILTDLMEQLAAWQPRAETFDQTSRARARHDVLVALAHGTRTTREEWADVMRVITETAVHDEAAARVQTQRIERYRSALGTVATASRRSTGRCLTARRSKRSYGSISARPPTSRSTTTWAGATPEPRRGCSSIARTL